MWGHVLFGRDIISSGSIPRVDPFSFLSDRPWINHEWLAECLMYLAYAAAGGTGLVLLKLSLLGAMVSAVVVALRRRGVEGVALDLLLSLAILGTFAQVNHVRPQVFSLTLFAWLLVLLTPSRNLPETSPQPPENLHGAPRWQAYSRLLAIPILIGVWVNLHGGWIVGGGVLALWSVCALLAGAPRDERRLLVAAGALALAATVLNPYGWHMWAFLWETVRFGREDIADWQPVYSLGVPFVIAWLGLALCAAAAIIQTQRTGMMPICEVAIVVVLAAASFRVNRLLAFFALSLVVLLGPQLVAVLARLQRNRTRHASKPSRRIAAAVLATAFVIIAGATVISARNATCVRIDRSQLPEPEIASLADGMRLRGRLVVWFDWGEYAIWHLGHALSVSIDGRRETVYSELVRNRHLQFYFVPSTRAAFLDDVRPDYIWLPLHLPVVSTLLADGWVPIYSGSQSVLLGKEAQLPTDLVEGIQASCFPGP